MQKSLRILVNGLTIEKANLVPLVKKMDYWCSKKAKITVLGPSELSQRLAGKYQKGYLSIGSPSAMGGGFLYLIRSLQRNFKVLLAIKRVPKTDVVYSISSVHDLIILPYFLKKTKRAKRWATVFDNTVPLVSHGKIISGNLVIRVLAWFIFKVSLFFLRAADTIFVVKAELKEYLISHGFDPRKLIVTGNGVEGELILKAKKRRKYVIDGLYLGRINEAKGIYDLLSVVALVKKASPHFQLAIVGDGESHAVARFKAKIKQMSLTKNVQLMGFKTGQEKYDIIKSCKIFLFLSQTESVPVAPLEAVCSGKITLVYDLDAYNMYKNNEVIIFKQGDHHTVAAKVVSLLKGGDFTNHTGSKLLSKYSWDSIAKTEFKWIN